MKSNFHFLFHCLGLGKTTHNVFSGYISMCIFISNGFHWAQQLNMNLPVCLVDAVLMSRGGSCSLTHIGLSVFCVAAFLPSLPAKQSWSEAKEAAQCSGLAKPSEAKPSAQQRERLNYLMDDVMASLFFVLVASLLPFELLKLILKNVHDIRSIRDLL